MVYGDFKDLNRRTAANKVLRGKALNIAMDPKYDGYQRELASIKFLKKNRLLAVLKMFLIKNQQKNYTNQLSENLIKENYNHLLQRIFGITIDNQNRKPHKVVNT